MASGIAIGQVTNPDVDGVKFATHPLQREAARLNAVAHRVGKRLMLWLRRTQVAGEVPLERVVGRDPETGRDITEPMRGADGEPILGPIMPDKDFRETWDLYERTTRNLLNEQRMRAAMTKGKPEIDDATFEAELAELARARILEMPKAELEALIRMRSIDVSVPDSPVPSSPAAQANPHGEAPTSAESGRSADLLAGFEDDDADR